MLLRGVDDAARGGAGHGDGGGDGVGSIIAVTSAVACCAASEDAGLARDAAGAGAIHGYAVAKDAVIGSTAAGAVGSGIRAQADA